MIENKDIMSAAAAAAFLGAHVETIRRLAMHSEIPSFKVGKDWRFRPDALRKWSETQQSRTVCPPVLIVDDDPVVCQAISRAVEHTGYQAISAGSGREGLEAIGREQPGLILLDLMMPQMNGAEFLKEVRVLHPQLPIAIITGYPDGELIAEAMKYGPLLTLSKPVDMQQLKTTVQMSLGNRSARRR